MRGDEHIRQLPERAVGGKRLGGENIQGGAGDLALAQHGDQCCVIHHPAARDIHQAGGGLEGAQGLGVQQAARGVGQRDGDHHEIAIFEHRAQRLGGIQAVDQVAAGVAQPFEDVAGVFRVHQVALDGQDGGAKGLQQAGDLAANAAIADDADRAAAQLLREEDAPALSGPFGAALGGNRFGELVAQRQQHHHGVLGHLRGRGAAQAGDQHAGALADGGAEGMVNAGPVELDPAQVGDLLGGGQDTVGVKHLDPCPNFGRHIFRFVNRQRGDLQARRDIGQVLDQLN